MEHMGITSLILHGSSSKFNWIWRKKDNNGPYPQQKAQPPTPSGSIKMVLTSQPHMFMIKCKIMQT